MVRQLTAFFTGLVFGIGLIIAEMTNPAKILNFLDLAGSWDPSLAFVMGGAVVVTFVGYRMLKGRDRPILDTRFHWPGLRNIDARLVGGSAVFGIGWGMVGLCPGPALTMTGLGGTGLIIFLVAMTVGMIGVNIADRATGRRPAAGASGPA
jgi:hypothetical protein